MLPQVSRDGKVGERPTAKLPQPFQRLQNPLDLLGAFLVLAAEQARQGLGVRSYDTLVVTGDELANDDDLIRQAIGPGRERC
jgi:hypothetical protein